jgi:RecA-family ATPase/5S rRNA maturation endonuclease (ribonuclease M5)
MSVNYFAKVRESVVTEIGMAPQGRRNEALNLAAYALGRHAHMDAANIDSSVIDLHTAAKAIGLQEHEIKATIGSGFKRGSENPKTLENDDAMPFQPSEMDRLIVRLASKELLIRDEETRAEKIAKAQAAWERSVPISRENKDAVRPALLYLNNRGMRAGTAAGVARFSPSLYDGPAILFPATNAEGDVCGVQAVLLTPNGKKREHNNINKYSRGSLVGNAMRIGDEHEGGAIILVEGPEDALSVRQAIMGQVEATIVCTFGKAGMKTFNAPRASDVTICADPDLDVEAVADVLRGDGSTDVHVVRFDALGVENVKDANDYLQEAGAEKLREALALAKPVEEVKQERIASERQWPTPYEPVDPASIPARRWIYGQHYIRSNVSVLASAGGVGKTSLQILESLCITTGKPLLGEAVHERCNVWVINLEDPLEEMQRRYAATMLHYGIAAEEVRGRLFLDAGRSLNMVFANQGREGTEVNDEMLDYMAKMIKQNNIGVMFIDPWVGANMINENDNVAMNAAVSAVRSVCDETDCAAGLVHHIRKGNGDEATVDSVRGAGSLIGAARAARVINKISAEDAQKLGVSEAESLGIFRVDDGKANLAPPAAKAVYRRMVGVQLPNMEYVGVATEYAMPDLFDGVSARDAMKVQRAVGEAETQGEPLRANVQAKTWVGVTVADVLGLDLEKRHEKAKAKAIVAKWIENGVLRKTSAPSKRDGREVPCVVVGDWITGEEAGI